MLHSKYEQKTSNGLSYVDLSIATNRHIRRNDTWEEFVDWHQVRTWEQTAELCIRMLEKGCTLAVEGQLRTNSWIDEQGEKKYKTYIQANRLHFLSKLNADLSKERVTEKIKEAITKEAVMEQS